jgi:hypothetical protein
MAWDNPYLKPMFGQALVFLSRIGRENNLLHGRLGPDVPGYAGARLPRERERFFRVPHLLTSRKLSSTGPASG